jgi:hypothetical protein
MAELLPQVEHDLRAHEGTSRRIRRDRLHRVDMNPIAECHRCEQGFAQRAPTFLVADLWLRLLPIHPSGPMDMAADLHGLAASKGAMSVHAGREVVVVRARIVHFAAHGLPNDESEVVVSVRDCASFRGSSLSDLAIRVGTSGDRVRRPTSR